MITVYGIKNCDTVKKSLDWLTAHKINYQFHNYKTDGVTAAKLKNWCKQKGWEVLLNKKSATWRGLEADAQNKITNEKAAIDLMKTSTSIIKRPVIENEKDEIVTIGFDATIYENVFLKLKKQSEG